VVVLDSDGVVKEKVGDFLIPVPVTIIGSGPLASAPVASAANQNMWYQSTDFGLCKYVSVFENAGTDLINCGFLPYLADIALANGPLTIELIYCTTQIGVFTTPVSWADSSSLINFAIKQRSSNKLWALNNGAVLAESTNAIATNVFNKVVASRRSTSTTITLNGISKTVVANSVFSITNRSFFIGGHPTEENMDGCVCMVRIYSGYTQNDSVSGLTLLDEWDFNKYAGGLTGASLMGYPFAVVDGTPETRLGYRCIPWSLLQ
jgi:hypothetical protein